MRREANKEMVKLLPLIVSPFTFNVNREICTEILFSQNFAVNQYKVCENKTPQNGNHLGQSKEPQ